MAKFQTPIKNYWEREQEFMRLLMTMESRGVEIDQRYCRQQRAIGESRMQQLHNEFGELSPNSHNNMIQLFKKANIPLLEDHKTDKGRYSFDKAAMEDYDRLLELRADKYSDLATRILEWRGWEKSLSAFYNPYLALVSNDGRLRCNYNQAGTKTGRLSCSKPNLQQIPRESNKDWNGGLKKAFVARRGYRLVSVDYSQLEFRLASSMPYAGQANLIEIFNRSKSPERWEKKDRDIFIQMCLEMGLDPSEARQGMKTLTYAKQFGAGMLKIAIMLGDEVPQWVRDNYRKPDPKEYGYDGMSHAYIKRYENYRAAWEFIKELPSSQFYRDWEEKYDRLAGFAKFVNQHANERMTIKTWAGRPRHFQKFKGGGNDSHKAFNSLIQGGGADIVKSAMLRLFHEVDGEDCRMLLQVHDSVVFEIREPKVDHYVPMIKEIMSRVEEEKDFGVYFAVEEEFWGK
jgi:DNA polymerase-1